MTVASARTRLLAATAALAVAVGVPLAVAESPSSDAEAKAAGLAKKVRKLQKQVRALQKQVASINQEGGAQGATGPQGPQGPQGAQGAQGIQGIQGAAGSDAQFTGAAAGGDLAGTYPNPTIAPGAVGSGEVAPNSLTGDNVNESTFAQVPSAALAQTANFALSLEQDEIEVNTNSVVVPGGTQDDSNGNGISRAVLVFCDASITGGDVAIGGGAHWSGNANSNSDEFENRIHSITYLDSTGDVASNGEIPRGIRVRGEVDKDDNDTLTAQVLCFPAF